MTTTLTDTELRQCWGTPDEFWKPLNEVYDFDIDAAAVASNTKCPIYFGPDSASLLDGLKERWIYGDDGFESAPTRIWCNPGFGDIIRPCGTKANFYHWVQKAYAEAQRHPDALCVVMGLDACSTEWAEFCQTHCTEIVRLRPRVQFVPPPGIDPSKNPKDNALYIFRRLPPWHTEALVRTWRWK